MQRPLERLEKKYGIKIVDDSYYNPRKNMTVTQYRIFSADGCPWENGLSYQGVFRECRDNAETLLKIKEKVENDKKKAENDKICKQMLQMIDDALDHIF